MYIKTYGHRGSVKCNISASIHTYSTNKESCFNDYYITLPVCVLSPPYIIVRNISWPLINPGQGMGMRMGICLYVLA